MDYTTLLLAGLAIFIIGLLTGRTVLSKGQGAGGMTLILDGQAISLTRGEINLLIAKYVTPQQRGVIEEAIRYNQRNAPIPTELSTQVAAIWQHAARTWLISNPDIARRKGYRAP